MKCICRQSIRRRWDLTHEPGHPAGAVRLAISKCVRERAPNEDRHKAPASTPRCPLSLQETGALPFPDLIVKTHYRPLVVTNQKWVQEEPWTHAAFKVTV